MGFDGGVDGAAKERILFGDTSPQIFGKNVPGLLSGLSLSGLPKCLGGGVRTMIGCRGQVFFVWRESYC